MGNVVRLVLDRYRPLLRAAVSAIALGVANGPGLAGKTNDLDTIVPELREGGYVIYLRHAATERSGNGDAELDLDRCETQRNLSAKGREQARSIGEAFRELDISLGTVVSSPFCRCKDTARLAFGRFTVDDDLYFAIGVSAEETERLAQVLRDMLSTPPKEGTNNVIVAHTANLREAASIWPKPEGVAYIFRPAPDNGFEVVGSVDPGQWARYASKQ